MADKAIHRRQRKSPTIHAAQTLACTAILAAALCHPADAQIVPPGPEAAAAVAAASKGPTGFFGNVAWAYRRVRLTCRTSNFGKFLTNAVRPVSKLTGGLIPVPNDNHFAAAVELNATKPAGMAPGAVPAPPPPPPPGVAAAAKIKTEQAQAAIRREAVAYLAGLDCRYYPEAEAALIASLRADRDECVRLEAAKAMASGCCCTPATAKALTICVTGSCEDGNPAERCGAVRQVALVALQRCQQCGCDQGTPDATPPEAPLGESGRTSDALQVVFNAAEATKQPTLLPVSTAESAAERTSFYDLWMSAKR